MAAGFGTASGSAGGRSGSPSERGENHGDMWIPDPSNMTHEEIHYKECRDSDCMTVSGTGGWETMTLRCGYDTCMTHTTTDMVMSRAESLRIERRPLFIFYDVEVTATREVDEIACITPDGTSFSVIIRTSVRRHNAANLTISKAPTEVYMMLSVAPRKAMETFVSWVRSMATARVPVAREEDVVMVAHGGSKHDHLLILKTMMRWGIPPPRWRFADTLPLFKIVICPSDKSALTDLVERFVPWFNHVAHRADSDARALMEVVKAATTGWDTACYVFSEDYDDFITSVGLNIYRIRDPIPFPDSPVLQEQI